MNTDENITMDRIVRTYYYFSNTSRYLFSDSRQRIVTYFLLLLCFFTPSSHSFVLYQGTTQKLEYKDLNMIQEMKVEDRRTIFQFCNFIVNFPAMITKKMSTEQIHRSRPICEQLLLGIKKVRELEKNRRVHVPTSIL